MAKKTAKSVDETRYKTSETDELFQLVKTNDGVIIVVGNYKVSRHTFKTFKDADEYLAKKPYEILINVSLLMKKLNQDEKEKNAAQVAENAEGVN